MIKQVRLTMPATTFAAVSEILMHVRLGSRNKWETALAEWFAEAEKDGFVDSLMPKLLEQEGYPTVSVEASDSEGLVINLK